MEPFRTTIEIPAALSCINYSSKVLFMGSCFAENMGEKLSQNKFQTLINPFGTVFNPVSIVNSLARLQNKEFFTGNDLFEDNGVWNSFSHHSRFSDTDKFRCLQNINQQLNKGGSFLDKTDFLILTFGTAWVYQSKRTGNVVTNCHKVPAGEFNRYRLSKDEIVEKCKLIFKELKGQNPNLQIIITVSPVRHLKDGFIENQLSKATLLLAAHELTKEVNGVFYFPSYEIMMDDLRDYRFYAEDMVHPSAQAIEYIWKKFRNSWINPDSFKLIDEVAKIHQAMHHKPFFPKSENHQKFVKKQLESIQQIMKQQPGIDLEVEKKYFESLVSD